MTNMVWTQLGIRASFGCRLAAPETDLAVYDREHWDLSGYQRAARERRVPIRSRCKPDDESGDSPAMPPPPYAADPATSRGREFTQQHEGSRGPRSAFQ